jgi:hypothetical protein
VTVAIARRTQAIAVQSVVAGVGLSVVAMGFAAAGLIAAAWGALLQEVIDVAVIVNALRARRDDRRPRHAPTASEAGLVQRFGSEHVSLRPELERVRGVGDALGGVDRRAAVLAARDLHGFLVDELLPHERAEAERLYPAIARSLGGDEPMASMQREHVEIAHQIRRLGRLLDGIDIDAPGDEDLLELRRLLYGLYAVLRLHFAQEDERYFAFTEDAAPDIRGTTGALST